MFVEWSIGQIGHRYILTLQLIMGVTMEHLSDCVNYFLFQSVNPSTLVNAPPKVCDN